MPPSSPSPALRTLLLTAILLNALSCGHTPESASTTGPGEIEFVTGSGLHVRMLPRPGSGLFASNVFVGAGSTREEDHDAGSSHFLEHLLFNGTTSRTQEEIYAEADRLGAYNNATTRREYTHFMMVAPSEEFSAAIELQADMLLHSTLPADKFEKERGIILEELSKDEDDPANHRRQMTETLLDAAAPVFARPVLGTRETLRTLDRDEVDAYYHRQYVPTNMKLLLMGDFDPDAARSRIEAAYAGTFADEARPAPPFALPEGSTRAIRRVEDEAVTLSVQLPAPTLEDPDFAPFLLLADVLGGGRTNRLRAALEAEPSLEPLEAGADILVLEGRPVLRVEIRLPRGGDAQEAFRRVAAEMASLAATGLHASDWAAARNRLLSETIRQVEQLHYYALLQGDRIWHAPPGFERALTQRIEDSNAAIPAVARRWFTAPPLTVAILDPDAEDRGPESFDPVSAGYEARADLGEPSPLPEGGRTATGPPTVSVEQRPSVTALNNGVTVIHAASPQTRMFALHLWVRDRSAREPRELPGLADLLHRSLPRGAGPYDDRELAALLDGIGAEWKVTDNDAIPYDDYYGTSPLFSFVRLDCIDLYWREAIRLLGLMVGDPRLDADAIERSRTEIEQRLAHDRDRPSQRARQHFDRLLLGEDHPWARPVFGVPGGLERVDEKTLRRFALDYLDPSQLVLAVVGDIDRRAVVEALEQLFDVGGSSGRAGVPPTELPLTDTNRREILEGGGRQSSLRMGKVIEIDPQDRWALEVAVGIASTRMQQDLRETRGLAYSLGIGVDFVGSRARLVASMGTRPQNLEEAERGLQQYLECGRLDADPQEIAAWVNRTLGRARMRRVTSIGQAYGLCRDLALEGGIDFPRRRSEGLRSVGPDEVARVSERYLRTSPMVRVLVR